MRLVPKRVRNGEHRSVKNLTRRALRASKWRVVGLARINAAVWLTEPYNMHGVCQEHDAAWGDRRRSPRWWRAMAAGQCDRMTTGGVQRARAVPTRKHALRREMRRPCGLIDVENYVGRCAPPH